MERRKKKTWPPNSYMITSEMAEGTRQAYSSYRNPKNCLKKYSSMCYHISKGVTNNNCRSNCGHGITQHCLSTNWRNVEATVARMTGESMHSMSNQFVMFLTRDLDEIRESPTSCDNHHFAYDFRNYNHHQTRIVYPPVFLLHGKENKIDNILQQEERHLS